MATFYIFTLSTFQSLYIYFFYLGKEVDQYFLPEYLICTSTWVKNVSRITWNIVQKPFANLAH